MKFITPEDWINNWNKAWELRSFKIQAAVTFLVLFCVAFFINRFFAYIQLRPGYQITDPLLDHIPPHNVSVYIFVLIYGALLLGLVYISQFPFILLKVAQAYCLVVMFRICTIFLIPLEPARLIIPLSDPLIDRFFYNNIVITKDLFFSGHVATLFLFVLAVPNPLLKCFFLIVTILVAVLILIQHVHYTIDILAAPLFSWISYKGLDILIIKN